jgi:hypothetical protein
VLEERLKTMTKENEELRAQIRDIGGRDTKKGKDVESHKLKY